MRISSHRNPDILLRRMAVTLLALAACALLLAALPLHADILLDANFDNKTLDQDIPTGGAAAGESRQTRLAWPKSASRIRHR